jgi:hypothetical protein
VTAKRGFNPGPIASIVTGGRANHAGALPKCSHDGETVEQFLARGGMVEKLEATACSRTEAPTQHDKRAIFDKRVATTDAAKRTAEG